MEVRETERYKTDEKYKKTVDEIIAEENRDREIIYARVLQVNEAAAEAGTEKVYEIFAKLNQDTSQPGTWLQLVEGTWVKKAKAKNWRYKRVPGSMLKVQRYLIIGWISPFSFIGRVYEESQNDLQQNN